MCRSRRWATAPARRRVAVDRCFDGQSRRPSACSCSRHVRLSKHLASLQVLLLLRLAEQRCGPCGASVEVHRLADRQVDAAVRRAQRDRWLSSAASASFTIVSSVAPQFDCGSGVARANRVGGRCRNPLAKWQRDQRPTVGLSPFVQLGREMSSRSGYSSVTRSRSRALVLASSRAWAIATGPACYVVGALRRPRAQSSGSSGRGRTLLSPAGSVPFAPTSGSVHDLPIAVQTLRARSRRNHPGAHVRASDMMANAVVEPLRAPRPQSGTGCELAAGKGFGAALGEASVRRSYADADVAAASVADRGPWPPRSMARARGGEVARKPVGRVCEGDSTCAVCAPCGFPLRRTERVRAAIAGGNDSPR